MKYLVLTITMAGLAVAQANNGQQGNSNKATNSKADTSAKDQQANRNGRMLKSPMALNSSDAADLLTSTEQARSALDRQDKQDALEHIDHALKNTSEILSRGDYTLVPLYAELNHYSTLRPGPSTTEASPIVQAVTGDYTSVAVDVKTAKDHLNAAKKALDEMNYANADAALAAITNRVVYTRIAMNLPLARARQNLLLAREAALEDNQPQVEAALESARDALSRYERDSGQDNGKVSELHSEIETFLDEPKLTNNTTDRIEDWWTRVANLTAAPQG